MKRVSFTLTILVLSIFSFILFVFADTIYLDGRKIEGKIIEENPTSVIIQTSIGKITFNKDTISNIEKVSDEEDYLQLGNNYFNQRRYEAAIDYYNRALEENPNYKQAQEALSQARREQKREELKRQRRLKKIKQNKESMNQDLEKRFGLAIGKVGNQFKIINIEDGSEADEAGLREYDTIVSIRYSPVEELSFSEVYEKLIQPRPIPFTVERQLNLLRKRINYKKRSFVGIGIFVIKQKDEIVITDVIKDTPAYKKGLKEADRIAKIEGSSVEDLTLDEAEELITGDQLTRVNVTIIKKLKIK